METTESIIERNIDSYLNNKSITQSTIDNKTHQLREKLGDETIGTGMVVLALTKLGEPEIDRIVEYVLRKAHSPGRAFVAICNKAIREKS